eukprot:CAMPEP_0198283546 /NCGR_PEP_ID=MMETSP1449-20131203/3110_1 /TAXON_ID=420275 /ORGANISM="Attheya septentrionalis, Strain CCMP2084" /LENGTH=513 /DNA_ID=CAMNT_0043980191 /DNA_START=119 /DNA_END=1660 /DNA_ORIENTATION=-
MESTACSNNEALYDGNVNVALSSFASLLSSAQAVTGAGQPKILPPTVPALAAMLSQRKDAPPVKFPGLCLRETRLRKVLRVELDMRSMAALKLALPVCADWTNVADAPGLLIENTIASFEALVNSRLRSSSVALAQQSLKRSRTRSEETRLLLKLLAPVSKPITTSTVITSFCVLREGDSEKNTNGNTYSKLPIIFEAIMDCQVLGGKMVTVNIQATGTIEGSLLDPKEGALESVEVKVDTRLLLRSMMQQARHVTKQAMKNAASIIAALNPPRNVQKVGWEDQMTQENYNTNSSQQQLYHHTTNSSSSLSRTIDAAMLQQKRQEARTTSDGAFAFPQHLQQTCADLFVSASVKREASTSLTRKPKRARKSPNDADRILENDDSTFFAVKALSNKANEQDIADSDAAPDNTMASTELFSWIKGEGMLLEEPNMESVSDDNTEPISPTSPGRKSGKKETTKRRYDIDASSSDEDKDSGDESCPVPVEMGMFQRLAALAVDALERQELEERSASE